MTTVANFLNYGLLGLCGLIAWLFWRVLDREQRREGQPRQGIIRFSVIFIALSLFLSVIGLTLELTKIFHDDTIRSNYESKLFLLKDQSAKDKAEIARLEERVSGCREVISILRKIKDTVNTLPSEVHGNTRISLPGQAHPSNIPVTLPIPANDNARSAIDSLVENAELLLGGDT